MKFLVSQYSQQHRAFQTKLIAAENIFNIQIFLNYLIKHICQENNVVSMDLNGQTIYTGHDYAQEF